jgi:GTP-binding protein HflX
VDNKFQNEKGLECVDLEKEIETDRRIVRDRIALLKDKNKAIDKTNGNAAGNRYGSGGLVGYTNVNRH